MFTYKKIVYFILGTATLGCAALIIATPVFAQTNTKHLSLSQDIANTYHLNEKSVHQTIAEYYKTHKKKNNINKILDRAVKKGKITESEKTAIINERKSLHNQLKMAKSQKNSAQRKAELKTIRTSAVNWAKAQHIKREYVFAGMKRL